MTLGKKIKQIAKSNRVLFTTPSHDRTSFVIPECAKFIGRKFFHHDLSEIYDLDNLAAPNGVIAESLHNAAKLCGVNDLFYLINGSTSGILASMLAVLKQNDEVLIARNCHKSVVNGLILTGAKPHWILPDFNLDWSAFNAVQPQKIDEILSKNQNIKVVIITSPTYEGVSSDIKAISEICHSKNAILIVDEAHGALKTFAPQFFGENAVKLGADICVQSLHKTCSAPNPCAILLSNGNVPNSKIQNALNIINTSSPSYPILAAIEVIISYLFSSEGKEKIEKLISDIKLFKNSFEKNSQIQFFEDNDPTKILVKINGLAGFDLSDILFDEFNIEDELANNSASLLLTGVGTSKHKLKLLEKALKTIISTEYTYQNCKPEVPLLFPDFAISPKCAYEKVSEEIPLAKSFGRISAETIAEYPPGIPFLIQGEKISHEHIKYLKLKRNLIVVVR